MATTGRRNTGRARRRGAEAALKRRVAVASLIGTTIEWYDFFIFGTAAALVFNALFFPSFDPAVGTLAAFATFGVGFIARPVGGAVGGHLGDRIGRKRMLVMTLLLTGLATFAIGLLPTYDAVGVWAPVLLVALRFVQGLGLGGEWAGALLMSVEHAPPNRRGLYASWPQVGLAGGLLLSTAAFAGAAAVTGAAFATWGWRIPFLLSVLLVGVGIFIRLRVVESPAFVQLHASGDRSRRPLVEVVRDHPWTMVFATGAGFSAFLIFYTGAVFVLAYATDQLGMPRSTVLVAVMIAAAAEAVTLPLLGALSDRIGRRPVCIAGAAFTALFAFPFFWLIDTGRPLLVGVALLLVFGVGHATYGATGALLAEQFPARVRYSGTSLSYQLTAVLVGAPTPLLASGLLAWSDGNSWPISALLALGGLVTLVSVHALTRPARARVRAARHLGRAPEASVARP